jgi:hypothetical protein
MLAALVEVRAVHPRRSGGRRDHPETAAQPSLARTDHRAVLAELELPG